MPWARSAPPSGPACESRGAERQARVVGCRAGPAAVRSGTRSRHAAAAAEPGDEALQAQKRDLAEPLGWRRLPGEGLQSGGAGRAEGEALSN